MRDNPILEKSYAFAKDIVIFYKYSNEGKYDKPLSKQLLRSGTSIGANIREAQRPQSKADFKSKINIALKEADETDYWIHLLHDTDYMSDEQFQLLSNKLDEIIRLLVSIIKSINKKEFI